MKRIFLTSCLLVFLSGVAAAQTDGTTSKEEAAKKSAEETWKRLEGFPILDLKEVWAGVLAKRAKDSVEYRIETFQAARDAHHAGNGPEAIRLFTHLANDANHTPSMRWLARMAYKGEGQAVDKALAYSWYEKAAIAGDIEAMVETGALAMRGEGRDASDVAARHWFLHAVDRGDDNAQAILLEMFDKGRGGPVNKKMAIVFGKQLARKYEVEGLMYMGVAYRDGDGVEQDLVKAKEMLEAAKEFGDPGAEDALAKLEDMK